MRLKVLKLFKNLSFFAILLLGVSLILQGSNFLNNYNNITVLDQKINEVKKIIDQSKLDSKFVLKKNKKKLKKNNDIKIVYEKKIINVNKNDTFSKILEPFITNNKIKNDIIYKVNEIYKLKNLNINQKIIFYLDANNETKKIIIPINFFIDLVINLEMNKIHVHKQNVEYVKEINSLEFIINSSLYADGIKAGLPLAILNKAIKLYSFDLDFQRDIKKNTIFKISYEVLLNEKRNELSYGAIEYINLIIKNQKFEYFIFKTDDGFLDYFDKEGKNVKKSLLKTPIDGAKLSSNFGMRKHPISGFNKLHKGVDFAAPTGTPVYSGGNGVIEYAGLNGGYGKYIRIKHNNEYKTAYAHLSNFKKGIKKGKRVNQGDIIAFVGSTGKSTGPHLHYEILYKDKQINPMKMKLPSGKILKDSELKKFEKKSKDIYAQYLFSLYE